jgi:hypothetical protein
MLGKSYRELGELGNMDVNWNIYKNHCFSMKQNGFSCRFFSAISGFRMAASPEVYGESHLLIFFHAGVLSLGSVDPGGYVKLLMDDGMTDLFMCTCCTLIKYVIYS